MVQVYNQYAYDEDKKEALLLREAELLRMVENKAWVGGALPLN